LTELANKLHEKGKKLSWDVDEGTVLKYYDKYSNVPSDMINIMGPTYYGTYWPSHIQKTLKKQNDAGFAPEKMALGVGTMLQDKKCDFGWTEKNLRDFIKWAPDNGYHQIDIWPCRNLNDATQGWYFTILNDFLQGN